MELSTATIQKIIQTLSFYASSANYIGDIDFDKQNIASNMDKDLGKRAQECLIMISNEIKINK